MFRSENEARLRVLVDNVNHFTRRKYCTVLLVCLRSFVASQVRHSFGIRDIVRKGSVHTQTTVPVLRLCRPSAVLVLASEDRLNFSNKEVRVRLSFSFSNFQIIDIAQ